MLLFSKDAELIYDSDVYFDTFFFRINTFDVNIKHRNGFLYW